MSQYVSYPNHAGFSNGSDQMVTIACNECNRQCAWSVRLLGVLTPESELKARVCSVEIRLGRPSMKTSFKLLCFLAVAVLSVAQYAEAQRPILPRGNTLRGGLHEPPAFRPVAGDLNIGVPGRIWLQTNFVEQGLGYEGSYATLGCKRRLFEDFLDGRWLFEGRAHYGFENEGFFTNIGLERVYSIKAAQAEVSTSIWYDYDGDRVSDDGLRYHQIGLSGSIKTRKWDLIGNGYFPVGTTGFVPSGSCFVGHNIHLQPFVDSALEGFDATLRLKPRALSFVNGTFDIGGYGYGSSQIDYFGGGRVRMGVQALRGAIVSAEISYDDRFDLTGVFGVGWVFGANPGTGSEYAGIGRDLEQTVRNDHIVRTGGAAVLAIDPRTGRPYNVVHVDNTADAAFEDGTVDRKYTTLAAAEANSTAGDIIFVDEGDGTSRGMRDGINLQDDQLFLGDGVQHLLQIQNNELFVLCNNIDGNRPVISAGNNGVGVNLASRNTVRGFEIDGARGNGGMVHGISGDSRFIPGTITDGIIEDNLITDAVLHGINLQETAGDWTFARNNINSNGFDGIRILDHCDPTAEFLFLENNVNNNGRDGISMENYDAEALDFIRNVTDGNTRDGVRLVNFKGAAPLLLNFQNHTARNNNGRGIHIDGGNGNLTFTDPVITGNAQGGIRVVNWTSAVGERTFIGGTDGNTNISNSNGIGIDIVQDTGVQSLFVTGATVNGNGSSGLQIRTSNAATQVTANILDNRSFSGNGVDGMRFISTSGSTQRILVDQPTSVIAPRLPIAGNGQNGISFLAGDNFPGTDSQLFGTVNNVSITGNVANGVNIGSTMDGFVEVGVTNSNIDMNGGAGVNIDTDNLANRVINKVELDNITMLDNAGQAVNVTTGDNTFTDVIVRNLIADNTVNIDFGAATNTVRNGGFLDGIVVNASGDDTDGGIVDNRTRLVLLGSQVLDYQGNGIEIDSTGDAHVLAVLRANLVQQSGFGPGTAGNGTGDAVPMTFLHGLDVQSADNSEIDLRLTANDFDANSERGILMTTNGTSRINSVWDTNDVRSNDRLLNPVFDLAVTNSAGSEICLAMSNTNFNLNAAIANLANPLDFTLELDGLTNGFTEADLPANFNFQPFGAVCDGLIGAEETAFAAAGFAPTE